MTVVPRVDSKNVPGGAETASKPPLRKPSLAVIIRSFFVIPFFIAVSCVLLFTAFRALTEDEKDVFGHLAAIRDGRPTERWQAAFELSSLVGQTDAVPQTDRFTAAMIDAFNQAAEDSDQRVRQYLALAMGRSGQMVFVEPLLAAIETDPEANWPYFLHALGALRSLDAAPVIRPRVKHTDARVRLQAVIALGNIGDEQSTGDLKGALKDSESNVRWDAAVALAKLGDPSGREVLHQLLDRRYLARFPGVDAQEVTQVLVTAIQAGAMLQDPVLDNSIRHLADNDPNVNVRKTAIAVIQDRAESEM